MKLPPNFFWILLFCGSAAVTLYSTHKIAYTFGHIDANLEATRIIVKGMP